MDLAISFISLFMLINIKFNILQYFNKWNFTTTFWLTQLLLLKQFKVTIQVL
jgi:hypothetical protein